MTIADLVLDGAQLAILGYLVWRGNLTYWDSHEIAEVFRNRVKRKP